MCCLTCFVIMLLTICTYGIKLEASVEFFCSFHKSRIQSILTLLTVIFLISILFTLPKRKIPNFRLYSITWLTLKHILVKVFLNLTKLYMVMSVYSEVLVSRICVFSWNIIGTWQPLILSFVIFKIWWIVIVFILSCNFMMIFNILPYIFNVFWVRTDFLKDVINNINSFKEYLNIFMWSFLNLFLQKRNLWIRCVLYFRHSSESWKTGVRTTDLSSLTSWSLYSVGKGGGKWTD